jgi:hypothetical protein
MAAAILVAFGCSTKPPMLPKPVENTWTIDAPLDMLWKSGIQGLVDKGVQIDIVDKDSGLIVAVENFDGGKFSEYIAEPQAFPAGEAKVNILFAKRDEKTTVVTIKPSLFGQGRTYIPLKMTSNGKLERDYFLIISGTLRKGKNYQWLEEAEPAEVKK